MKLTSINARVDRSGKHNDRNFNYEESDHIKPELTCFNRTWNYAMDDSISFRDAELNFYTQEFSEHLDRINEKYIEYRKPNRIKSMEEYYCCRRSQPEDRIIQVGNYKDSINPDDLWDLANDYRREFNKRFYPNCQILTMALHADETTPHVHIRRVWCATDKDGYKYVNQTKALEELGYKMYNSSRYENAKKRFTCEDRLMLYNIAKEYYSDLNISDPEHRCHIDIRNYKLAEAVKTEKQIEDKYNDFEKNINALFAFYKNTGVFNDEKELEELLSLPRFEALSKMHEIFIERLPSLSGKELDTDLLR